MTHFKIMEEFKENEIFSRPVFHHPAAHGYNQAPPSWQQILRSDPDRAAILNVARANALESGTAKVTFIVKDMVKDGNFAYLCALELDNGELSRTDESLDVYTSGFWRDRKGWHDADIYGQGLAVSQTQVDCRVSGKSLITAAQIRSAMANAFANDVRFNMEFNGLSTADLARSRQLHQAGIIQGNVDVEEKKALYDNAVLSISISACSDKKCRAANRHAYVELKNCSSYRRSAQSPGMLAGMGVE